MINKNRIITCLLLFFLLFLVGCQKSDPVDLSESPRVLTILGPEMFFKHTLDYFLINESDVEIEVIDEQKIYEEAVLGSQGKLRYDPAEKINKIITGPTPPDVIYVSIYQLRKYVDDGWLISLDEFIDNTHFDLEGITPSVIEAIRNEGNGTMYALSPTFNTQVLYYNKDFFDKMELPYPEDRMSWEQIFNLARQLTHEEDGIKYYGFAFNGAVQPYYNLQDIYLPALDISMFDADFTHFIVNTPTLLKAWKEIIALYNDGAVAPPFDSAQFEGAPPTETYFNLNPFMGGRAAMTVRDYGYMMHLEDMERGRGPFSRDQEQLEPFDWDIVTYPVHSEAVDVGSSYSLTHMMGINAKSEQPELAWKYISFMNGDKAAKAAASRNTELMSRFEYVKQPLGKAIHLDAFTKLRPAPSNVDTIELKRLFPNGSLGNSLSLHFNTSTKL